MPLLMRVTKYRAHSVSTRLTLSSKLSRRELRVKHNYFIASYGTISIQNKSTRLRLLRRGPVSYAEGYFMANRYSCFFY
ncbi:unnamed protein product [Rhodiola kirilowii]